MIQYILLQIKDYILHKQLAERCSDTITTILYFHDLDCAECKEQSIVLDEIHKRYPMIRIYWFDISGDNPALDTLLSMFQIQKTPSLVIGDKKYESFYSLDALEALIPDEVKEAASSLSTTSSEEKTTANEGK